MLLQCPLLETLAMADELAGVGRFSSSFLIFWKGASNRTVKATEAKNMQIYSLVSNYNEILK